MKSEIKATKKTVSSHATGIFERVEYSCPLSDVSVSLVDTGSRRRQPAFIQQCLHDVRKNLLQSSSNIIGNNTVVTLAAWHWVLHWVSDKAETQITIIEVAKDRYFALSTELAENADLKDLLQQVSKQWQVRALETFEYNDDLPSAVSEALGCHVIRMDGSIERDSRAEVELVRENDDWYMDCASSCFSEHYQAQLIQLWQSALSELAIGGDKKLAAIPLYEWSDSQRAAFGLDGPVHAFSGNLINRFHQHVAHSPKKVAVKDRRCELSYRELDQWSDAWAATLAQAGVEKGTPVGLAFDRGVRMVAAQLAVLKLGAIFVPVDAGHPQSRLQSIQEDTCLSFLLTESTHQSGLEEKLPDVNVLSVDTISLNNVFAQQDYQADTSDIAYIIFTSGSTGKPKGVRVSHGNLINFLDYMDRYVGAGDISTQFAPFTFDASVAEIHAAVLNGGSLVVLDAAHIENPDSLQAFMSNNRVTFSAFPPSYAKHLSPHKLPYQKTLLTAGSAPDHEFVNQWQPHLTYINAYGPTETTILSTLWEADKPVSSESPIVMGSPICNTRVSLVNRFNHMVPPGFVGELIIGGEGVTHGYINRQQMTAEKFEQRDGMRWYHSGDLVSQDQAGRLIFCGRVDNQVKLRGHRLELGEVETAIKTLPGIRNAAALITTENLTAQLYAFCEGEARSEEEFRSALTEALPQWAMPNRVYWLDALPLTVNGKVNYRELENTIPNIDAEGADDARMNELEIAVSSLWENVLQVPQVTLRDNFIHLGGDSLTALVVASSLKKMGYVISSSHLLKTPVFEEFVNSLAQFKVAEQNEQDPFPVISGEVPFSAIQNWFFSLPLNVPNAFCQSLVIASEQAIDPVRLQNALVQLCEYHDVLRTRFSSTYQKYSGHRATAQDWRQHILAPAQFKAALTVVQATQSTIEGDYENLLEQLTANISLDGGPLWQMGLIESEQEHRLVWVLHHLLVDTISHGVLLDDLYQLYSEQTHYRDLLPAKTLSYADWSERQLQHIAHNENDVFAQWLPVLSEERDACRISDVVSPFGTLLQQKAVLDAELTDQLTNQACTCFKQSTEEMVLAATVLGLSRTFGKSKFGIDIEWHGRDEDFAGARGISRTLGWFTSVHPLFIDVDDTCPGDFLVDLKELRAKVPNRGRDFYSLKYFAGKPEICEKLDELFVPDVLFNFSGVIQRSKHEWKTLPVAAIEMDSRNEYIPYNISVESELRNGELNLHVFHNADVISSAQASQLLKEIEKAAGELVQYCAVSGNHAWTPSDFPLLAISRERVKELPANITSAFPLTDMQQTMVNHQQQYQVWMYYRIPRSLDAEALGRAIAAVVAKHPCLRSCVKEWGSQMIQVVLADWQPKITFHASHQQSAEDFAEKLIANARQNHVSVVDKPAITFDVIESRSNDFLVLLSIHHFNHDGWSINLIFEALFDEYRFQLGESKRASCAPLNTLESLVEYQQQLKASEDWNRYWRELPWQAHYCELPRKSAIAESGQRDIKILQDTLPSQLVEKVRSQAKHSGITLNALLMSAYACLLRYIGRVEQVRFGVIQSGRSESISGIDTVTGCCVNTLPLVLNVKAGQSGEQIFTAVNDQLNKMRESVAFPLSQVQALAGNAAGEQLFESLFNIESHNYAGEKNRQRPQLLGGYEATNSALSFAVVESAGEAEAGSESQFGLRVGYDQNQFSESDIRQLMAGYCQWLTQLVENPNLAWNSLHGVADKELLTLNDWSTSISRYPRKSSVWELFGQQVDAQPEKTALWEARAESEQAPAQTIAYTYTQLHQRAEQLARRINLILPVTRNKEAIIGVFSDRSADAIVAWLAILRLGYAYLPLDPKYPAERLEHMLNDTGCQLVLSQNTVLANTLSDKVPASDALQILSLDQDSLYRGELPDIAETTITPQQLAYVMYTSGSTGLPKGVMIEQASIVRLIKNTEYAPLTENDHILLTGAPVFDATTYEVWGSLLNGGTLSIVGEEVLLDTERLADTLRERAITTLWLTAPLFNQHVQQQPAMFKGVAQLLVGGDALSVEHIRLAKQANPELTIINGYGPTENTTFSVCHRIEPHTPLGELSSIPIGKPIHNSSAYVVNDAGQRLPIGVAGELWVGGDGVARGYLNRDRLTAEKFIDDPFSEKAGAKLYKTGDLVRWTPDGVIEFIGRVDDQVKIRGFRIELGEIETVLTKHADVEEARVLVKQDAHNNKQLVAYVAVGEQCVEKDSAEFKTGLQRWVSETLPDYMVPAAAVVMNKLPLNQNGKVDRKKLPEPVFAISSEKLIQPGTEAEEILLEIWQKLLGVQAISVTDNFFTIGGDSILAIRVVAKAREAGLMLSVKKIFEGKNIRAIAAAASAQTETVLVAEQPVAGEQKLLPIHHDFFTGNPREYNHFNQQLTLLLEPEVSLQDLTSLLTWLMEKHDAMRLRYTLEQGEWLGHYVPVDEISVHERIEEYHLEELHGDALDQAIDDIANRGQTSLDINSGFTCRWLVMRTASETRLLWIMHHLIVDGVSWRILLQDFHKANEALKVSKLLPEIQRSSSCQAWANALCEFASSEAMAAEKSIWLPQAELPLPFITQQGGDFFEKDTCKETLCLSENHTRQLLQKCQQAYHTQINDLLLASLVLSIQKQLKENALHQRVRIDLEGHGREELFNDLDLSETVGWFTALYPVFLPLLDGDISQTIVETKETLAAVPNNGVGYGVQQWLAKDATCESDCAALSFNYLGQLDTPSDQGLRFSLEQGGNPIGGERLRSHPIRITGFVKEGRLQFVLDYHPNQVAPAAMKTLAQNFHHALEDVISHCASAEPRYTPADFPLATVTPAQLLQLQTQHPTMTALYPATGMQQNLLLQSLRADTQADVYVTQLRFSFSEADAETMRKAWQEICQRHAIFRTLFVNVESDRPLQLVQSDAHLAWQQVQLSDDSLGVDKLEARIEELANQQRLAPFAFDVAPAQRFLWIETSAGKELIWTHHHALIDGWCLSLLLDELLQLYAGFNSNTPVTLAAVKEYETYIAWLQQRDGKAEAYWRDYLAGSEGATPLSVESHALAKAPCQKAESIALEGSLSRGIERLAQTHGVTVNAVLQGAWALLLSKYSGEKDILFGTTVSGRPAELQGADKMVGLFINSLPVRYQFNQPQQSVGEWLADIHENILAATEFSHVPVAEIQQHSDLPASSALFESVLVFENYPLDISNLNHRYPGQPAFKNISGQECSDLPLNLVVYPGDCLQIKLAYLANKFDQKAMRKVLQHFTQILQSLTQAKNLSEVSLLTHEEVVRATETWNQTGADYPREKTIFQCFVDRCRQQPEARAIVDSEQILSYAGLQRRAEQLALRLADSGVARGMRVAVSLPRGADLVASILAIMKLGASYVPVALDCPVERRRFIVDDAGIAHTIVRREHLHLLDELDIAPVLVDGPSYQNGDEPYLPTIANSESEAYVIYTSGTTGTPKGVSISHRSLVNLCWSCMADNWLQAGDNTLQFAPYTFDASMAEIFVSLLSGGCLHMVSESLIGDPNKLQHYLLAEDIRLAAFPPQYLQQLDTDAVPSSLTVLTAGSAPTLTLVEAWGKGHRYFNAYGPTETTVLSSAWEYDAHTIAGGKLPIGRPLANTSLYIVDHFGQLCAPGQKGEIVIGGDGVALGYINRPEQSARQFQKNRWQNGGRLYRTGDLGRWLDDGSIEFLGRCDQQVKIRGYRIEPDEIEHCCVQLDEVRQCAVLPIADSFGDLKLVAFLETDMEEKRLVASLKSRISAELPPYMMPAQFVLCEKFAMTANGKINRKALAALPQLGESKPEAIVGNVSAQEEQLLSIWRHFLAAPGLQVDDDFFEFGGNSILLLRMMKPMKDAGFDISVNEFYQRKTVRKCCEIFAASVNNQSFWQNTAIPFDIVTLLSRKERLDVWLVDDAADRTLVDDYFASLPAEQLPDFVEYTHDLAASRKRIEELGKKALGNWHYPYQRSLQAQLNKGLQTFCQAFKETPVSGSIPFTPMQESMLEWQGRTVFDLFDVYGLYSPEQLQAAVSGLLKDQEMLRAINCNGRWQILDQTRMELPIPHLDIRYLDYEQQHNSLLQLTEDLTRWQTRSGLPYALCWVSVSDTKHYLMMVNDHLISDESSSLAIKTHLRNSLGGQAVPQGRSFAEFAASIDSNLNQDSVQIVQQQLDLARMREASINTAKALAERRKKPVQRALFRVPLDHNSTPVDQAFSIFRKLVCELLEQENFCMSLNHYGRRSQGENDFHQVGLFLDKIPFPVSEETQLEAINAKVSVLEDYGVNFVGLSRSGYLGSNIQLPNQNNEILFNYQGDQNKDPIVQHWFSRLNVRKLLKQFNGIVFEARQLDKELSIHCLFRGSKAELQKLVNSFTGAGARAAERSLDSRNLQLLQQQRRKTLQRQPLYTQLTQREATMEYAIKVSQLKKSFGDFEAVKGVNFCVEKGKCFGILGPNGAGKTTLLGMIEGITKPSSGDIQVLGMDIKKDLKNIQPHIGVQLQQNNYFQFLTVEEMLKFYRDFRAASSNRNCGLSIDELLDKLSLSDKRKAKVEELSGGQQQRLTIAVALLEDPDIVFLDEPTSALDPQNRRYTWEFIEQLKAKGDKTIIITTHYMEEAERLCDEILIMNAGEIISQGTPDQLIENLNAHHDISVLLGKGSVDDERLRNFSGVTNISWGGTRKDLTISTTKSATTLKELLEYSEKEGIELLQFNINRPSLEDVFLSSTGKELRE